MSLGYVPFLRPGALIFTAIVWQYLLNGRASAQRAIEGVYGRVGGRKRNILGDRVAYATRALFADSLSPEDVLHRHTLFGVYSRALSRSAADSWCKSLVAGERHTQPRSRVRVASFGGLRLSTTDLRSCRSCVEQDEGEVGFPSWRVLHLLPALLHCPYHGDALVSEVAGSVGDNMWEFRLPSTNGDDRKSQRTGPASDGYAMYLRYWVELFEGRLQTVEAHSWANLMDLVVERIGGTKQAIGELTIQLTRSWGKRPEELVDMLGPQIMRDFVGSELEHRSAPGRVAQKLVILTACEQLKLAPIDGIESNQLSLPLPTSEPPSQFAEREKLLRSAILGAGFPLAMLRGLAIGSWVANISTQSGIHRHRIQQAIDGFTDELLHELYAIGNWADNSWLCRVMRRREGGGEC